MNTHSSPMVVVGSIAFDDLEMPSGSYRNVLGGAATYSSIAASILGPVQIVGVIGDDFAEQRIADLRARGIDTQGIERARGETFRWHGRYSDDLMSRATLATHLNVFAEFEPKIPAPYRKSDWLLLGNIHPTLQSRVLDQMEKPRFVVADTMNFWISGEPQALASLLKRVDLLVINDEEARDLSGVQNIVKAAREILKRGPKHLIIKRGEHGALLFNDDGIFFTPAYPLEEVLDPTGAGDSFAGGLVGHLAQCNQLSTRALHRAMVFGSAIASFCVEAIGPSRLLEVTNEELSKRLEAFRALVDYGQSFSEF